MTILTLCAGLLLLLIGGEFLVRGAVALARSLGVSPLLIGLTLVGFGTSTPELLTSLEAALAGSPGIAVGNVVGSNIANILLILGIAAVIMPIPVSPDALRRDGSMMLVAALACVGLAVVGRIEAPAGIALVALLVGYVVYTYRRESRVPDASASMHAAEAGAIAVTPQRRWVSVAVAIAGLAMTLLGARLLVHSAIDLAEAMGVSDAVIGLTIVAVGTSLPELATSVMAALRRQSDVALGNVLGSNIYNVLAILGITAIVTPVDVPAQIATFDVYVMLAVTLLLLGFAFTGRRLSRGEGGTFVLLYAAYVVWLGRGVI
ncbi:MAG: calcium/sodium antiporter [Inquilinaceae bacterium]